MKDPYKVLGVSESATDEEVKKAYLALARKYHPDKYTDSDLADLASEKMKEVNAAYEEIQNMRASGGAQGGSSQGSSYGYGSQQGEGSGSFAEIRRLINMGYIDEAERRLNSMGIADRGAEWKFLMGCVCVRRMRFADAEMHFENACADDPYNTEYRMARDNLRRQTGAYGGAYRTASTSTSACDCCSSLICADCCCECMGGDLIRCC